MRGSIRVGMAGVVLATQLIHVDSSLKRPVSEAWNGL